jgi:hypothetical protein
MLRAFSKIKQPSSQKALVTLAEELLQTVSFSSARIAGNCKRKFMRDTTHHNKSKTWNLFHSDKQRTQFWRWKNRNPDLHVFEFQIGVARSNSVWGRLIRLMRGRYNEKSSCRHRHVGPWPHTRSRFSPRTNRNLPNGHQLAGIWPRPVGCHAAGRGYHDSAVTSGEDKPDDTPDGEFVFGERAF